MLEQVESPDMRRVRNAANSETGLFSSGLSHNIKITIHGDVTRGCDTWLSH